MPPVARGQRQLVWGSFSDLGSPYMIGQSITKDTRYEQLFFGGPVGETCRISHSRGRECKYRSLLGYFDMGMDGWGFLQVDVKQLE